MEISEPEQGKVPDASNEVTCTFQDFSIDAELIDSVKNMGWDQLSTAHTTIFKDVWEDKDVVVRLSDENERAIAYGLPLLQKLETDSVKPGLPCGLVLTPTREATIKVTEILRRMGQKNGYRFLALFNGMPIGRQIASLKTSVDIVVGTPKRIVELIRRQNLALSEIKMIVMDEADEIVSMGAWDDVTRLLSMAPVIRQNLLFTGTFPYEVVHTIERYLREPKRFDFSDDHVGCQHSEHQFYEVTGDRPKLNQLLYLLDMYEASSIVIFGNTRHETESLARYLNQGGFAFESLYGRLRPEERQDLNREIDQDKIPYLVITDIAKRGITIDKFALVINYNLPIYPEVYLNRVGLLEPSEVAEETEHKNMILNMVDANAQETIAHLEQALDISFSKQSLTEIESIAEKRSRRIMKELLDKAHASDLSQHLTTAQEIVAAEESSPIVAFLLKNYYDSRAYENERRSKQRRSRINDSRTFSFDSARRYNNKNRRRGRKRGRRGDSTYDDNTMKYTRNYNETESFSDNNQATEAGFPPRIENTQIETDDQSSRVRVNIGSDDGFRNRGAIARKIAALAGLNDGRISEVECGRHYAILRAAPEIAELIVDRVDGAPLGKKVIEVVSEE